MDGEARDGFGRAYEVVMSRMMGAPTRLLERGFEGTLITHDVSVLQTQARAHEIRLNALSLEAELRDRTLWTRLRWLLTGRVDG